VKAEVETRQGRIRGTISAGIHAFRGVPYAAPPVGRRRFLPPEPADPWRGIRDATRPGPAAPQFSMPVFNWINLSAGKLGDDCLNLNVWTPALDGERRPVLVWIHGGGFLVGSGSTPIYSGQDLARRGECVVVTLNYRLGALGYLHLSSIFGEGFEQSSNLGVRDQIAALEWVNEHIDRFGGDPQNVTLFGQSAGAMSIAALLGAPRARRLFHRAVCMSGAADHVIEPELGEEVAAGFLKDLGGPAPTHNALARVSIDRILHAQRQTMQRMADLRSLMVFLPMVDGDVIPEHPLDAIRNGAAAHIPILTGTTLEEWKLFRLIDQGFGRFGWGDLVRRFASVLPIYDDAPEPGTAAVRFREALGERSAARRPSDVWSAFQTARVFFNPAARLAEAQHAGGGVAHSYLFTWRPPAMRRSVGACHAIDIPFVFGSAGHPLARPFTGISPAGGRLGRKIQHAWLEFARDGRPGHDRLPAWPHYEPRHRSTMVLGRECVLEQAPLDRERALLESWNQARPRSSRRSAGVAAAGA
jgi:para-nitrobenzyl esterase